MISTYSKFYYGYEITSTTKWLDIDEGSGAIGVPIATGSYSFEDLAQAVEDALNTYGTFTYTVTTNRSTRKITIASSGATDYLASTGAYKVLGVSAFSTLGYPATDVLNSTSYASSTAIGTVYSPQYKLQDYVDQKDNREQRQGTISVSSNGKVQMQSFGVDRMFEFSIKFATDIYQPSSGPIINNKTGVDDLRAFMQFCIEKKTLEFMPDKDAPSTYYRVVFEEGGGGKNGMGYKLMEQFGRGLTGYFETGILTFRIIED